jgi:hypothetical protein
MIATMGSERGIRYWWAYALAANFIAVSSFGLFLVQYFGRPQDIPLMITEIKWRSAQNFICLSPSLLFFSKKVIVELGWM